MLVKKAQFHPPTLHMPLPTSRGVHWTTAQVGCSCLGGAQQGPGQPLAHTAVPAAPFWWHPSSPPKELHSCQQCRVSSQTVLKAVREQQHPSSIHGLLILQTTGKALPCPLSLSVTWCTDSCRLPPGSPACQEGKGKAWKQRSGYANSADYNQRGKT